MSAESSDLVIIIVPFYSHPEYLPQSIKSALGQTYEHLEIIVVGDGSPHDLTTLMQPYLSDPYAVAHNPRLLLRRLLQKSTPQRLNTYSWLLVRQANRQAV